MPKYLTTTDNKIYTKILAAPTSITFPDMLLRLLIGENFQRKLEKSRVIDFSLYFANLRGLPRWLSGKESCVNRRHGSKPRVRKILWRRKWQLRPVFLPGKSHGQRSLAGYSP